MWPLAWFPTHRIGLSRIGLSRARLSRASSNSTARTVRRSSVATAGHHSTMVIKPKRAPCLRDFPSKRPQDRRPGLVTNTLFEGHKVCQGGAEVPAEVLALHPCFVQGSADLDRCVFLRCTCRCFEEPQRGQSTNYS